MAKLLIQCLFLVVWFVNIDSQNNPNRPKIITQNGDIIIEAALNKNIVLRPNGPNSAVLAGDNNLGTSSKSDQYQYSSNSENFGKYFIGPSSVISRLEALENQTSKFTTNSRPSSTILPRRVNRLIADLQRQIQEIKSDRCESNPCEKGGTCLSLANGYHCLCPSNWEGKNCDVDVNECRNFAGTDLGCQNGATCINRPGTYECICSPGWYGLHCTRREKDCSQGNFEMCGHGTCIPTNGGKGFTCLCDQGWKTDGTSVECLTDIDECDASFGPRCSVNPKVQCFNWPGSFRCGQCPAGYVGDGFTCNDVNECLTIPNGGCSPLVTCHNTVGSRICGSCPAGYEGDGLTCTYRGSCNINHGGCHPSAQCVENMSTVQCVCPFGMDGDGIGIHGCYISSLGNYSRRCEDRPCGNHGQCHQLLTGYTCLCYKGYSGPFCDIAADSCSQNPCHNGGTCISENSVSGFRCECTSQYTGRLCEMTVRNCGGYLASEEGSIVYPSTNTSYNDNSKCAWVIHTLPSKVINVTFSKFNLEPEPECLYDFLQIHDGRTSSSQLIGRFCGYELPKGGKIVSSHNSLYFWFRSDDTRAGSGFALHWNSIDPICGGEINASTHGLISSPGSPGKYPPNRDCYWYLSTTPSKRISLSFFTLDIEFHENCSFDYLALYNGRRSTDPLINKYCNTTQPQPVTSTSSDVMIHFHSDSHGTGHGFQISFAPVEGIPGCGGLYTLDKGEIISPSFNGKYLDNLRCEYKISAGADYRIRIEFVSFDLEVSRQCRYDYVKVYDGASTDSKLIGKFCGKTNYPRNPILSSSNNLVIILRTDRNINFGGFRIKFETICQKTVYGDSGFITSPGYPFTYPPNKDCEYVINTEPGKAIQLSFQDFNMEDSRYYDCRYDFVEVRDGPDRNSSSMGKFCGSSRFPPAKVSTHNYLYVRFHSDLSNPAYSSYKGFYANYTTINTKCGGIFKQSTAIINHPSSGDLYERNQNCQWLLIAPEGMHIKLTWHSFDVEANGRCYNDYLELVEIDDENKEDSLGKFCGTTPPPALTTSSTRLLMKFRSDYNEQKAGFSVAYQFLDASKACGGTYVKSYGLIYSPGWPKRYEPDKDCTWTIQVPVGQQIALNITQFDLEQSHRSTCDMGDYLEIRNGLTQLSPLIGKYCGSIRSKLVTSMTNALYLHFHSDFYITGSGFKIEWTSTATRCGGTLTSSNGSIASPNYPENYNDNQECFYRIITNQGSRLRIHFVELDLERTESCKDDYVEIFDGNDENSPSLGRYCSMVNLLYDIKTTTNIAFLKFRADFYISGKGFYMNYDTTCNNNITGLYGIIESPNYPSIYPTNTNCLWIINVPKGHTINITFTNFNIYDNLQSHVYYYSSYGLYRGSSRNNNRNCMDYVQLKESNELQFSKKYCGNIKPPKHSTKTNSIQIKFVSQDYFPKTGFRLEWVNVGCGGIIQKEYGTLNLQSTDVAGGETECQWIIEAPLGKKITIEFTNVYMSESTNCTVDAVELFNGKNIDSPPISKFCNHLESAHRFQSTSNFMLVRFVKSSNLKDIHFTSSFHTMEKGCGGAIRSHSGMIYSPNYPNNYDNDLNCIWLITVPKNHRIELNFLFFDLYDVGQCSDSIKIYDTLNIRNSNYTQQICANWRISPIISKGNNMVLQFTTNYIGTAKGFKANFTVTCGATIIANADGIITNDKYFTHTNRSCLWIIKAPRLDQRVTLTITHMSIPETTGNGTNRACPWSFLRILDGDDENAPMINEYCGSYTPKIVSRGSAITIELGTYGDRIDGQFTAHYSSLDNACGGYLTSERGEVSSPNYPNPYPPNSDCEWTLSTSPGNQVYINFEAFDLETSENCNQDYVEIRENDGAGHLLRVYCGDVVPTNTTVASKLYIKFRSDSVGSNTGFLFKYGFLHGNEITGKDHGVITSPLYPHLFDTPGEYTWRIIGIGSKNSIAITITRLVIHTRGEQCTNNLVIYDGYDEEAAVLENICGVLRENEKTIRSSSDVVLIKLTLDELNTGSLFYIRWTEVNAIETEDAEANKVNCGSNMTKLVLPGNSTYFTSPHYPENYDDELNCEWIFRTSTGRHLVLEFLTFHMEERPRCYADYLSVYSSDLPSNWKPVRTEMCLKEQTVGLNSSTFMKINFVSDYSITAKGFQGRVNSVCGGLLTDLSGVVSPLWFDWNNGYGVITCEWKVKVRLGRQINLRFLEFNVTNENNDCSTYVILRNGESSESPLLGSGKYCGMAHEIKNNLKTSGNTLFIRYHTTKSSKFQHFTLYYKEENIECGGTSSLSSEHTWEIINSPNFPSTPIPYTECVWVFSGPPGEILRIDFVDRFDIDNKNSDCSTEFVEVRDGITEFAPILGRFCTDKPGTIKTRNNMLYVKYSTQISEPRNGFKANISIDVCGGTIYASVGDLSSPGYPHMPQLAYGTVCVWQLIGRAEHPFTIRFQDILLPDPVSPCATKITVEESIPENNTVTILKTFCGDHFFDKSDTTIQTFTNNVTIKLHIGKSASYSQTSQTRGFRLTFNSSIVSCFGPITTSEGYLTTPYYPRLISIRYCHWIITVPDESRRVTLELMDFDSSRQRIGIYSVNEKDNLATIQTIPNDDYLPSQKIFESTENSLIIYVWLDAPAGSTHRFKAKFSSDEPALCGGSLDGPSGNLVSPNLNRSYTCRWRYNTGSANSTNTIVVKTQLNSSSDSVRCRRIDPNLSIVYYYTGIKKIKQSINICGQSEIVHRIPSNAFLLLAKKNKHDSLYFNVDWNTQPCGGYITASETPVSILQTPNNFNDSLDCAWVLSAPTGNRVEISLSGSFQFECNDEFIKIYPNDRQSSNVIGDYCKDKTQDTALLAEFSKVFIEYHSKPRNNTNLKLTAKLTQNQCGQLMSNEETFSSPNYPKQYTENLECAWEIKTDLGSRVSLQFIGRFAIEGQSGSCTEDAVIVYDWKDDAYFEIVRLCGRELPPLYNSTFNRMKVVLRTNDKINLDGFKARWTRICGGEYIATEVEQFLYSPSYPHGYPANKQCVYRITSSERNVNVKFLDFDLEGPYPSCGNDNLTIDAMSPYEGLVNIYCGTNSPPLLKYETVTLTLRTDSLVYRRGFKLSYWVTSCGSDIKEPTVLSSSPIDTTYDDNLNCTWKIEAPHDKIVVLTFINFDLEYSYDCYNDYLAIYDGLSIDEDRRLALMCGIHDNSSGLVIKGTNNTMLLNFITDSSGNGAGFKAVVSFSYSESVGCGGHINLTSSKILKSPLIGSNVVYENYLDCIWTISAPEDHVIKIEFTSFHIAPCQDVNQTALGVNKCDCDYVQIRDGIQAHSSIMNNYCGHTAPMVLASPGNSLSVILHTDGEINSSGFEATLSIEESICGPSKIQVTTNKKGVIKSPTDKNGWVPRGLHCKYDIETDSSYSYKTNHILIKTLDLQPGSVDANRCDRDKLVISKYEDLGNATIGKKYVMNRDTSLFFENSYLFDESDSLTFPSTIVLCGNKKSLDFYVFGHLSLNLQTSPWSDSTDSHHRGFEIEISSNGYCTRNYSDPYGRVKLFDDMNDSEGHQDCYTLITAPINHTVSAYFITISPTTWVDDMYLKIYDGNTTSDKELKKISINYNDILTAFSTGRYMLIHAEYRDYGYISYDLTYVSSERYPGCGGKLVNEIGRITSPMYPEIFRQKTTCEWELETPPQTRLRLRFSTFDLNAGACGQVYVQLVDKQGNVISQYCDETPADYTSTDNYVKVVFVVTNNNGGTGWVAEFIGIV